MHTLRFLVAGGLALFLAAGAVAACGDDDDDADESATEAQESEDAATEEAADGEPAAGGDAVAIEDFAFDPADLQVEVGTSVTWTNIDPQTHTVTADEGAFDSSSLSGEASFEFTFDEAGTFAYHCEIHPAMTATVVVGGGAAIPEEGGSDVAGASSVGY